MPWNSSFEGEEKEENRGKVCMEKILGWLGCDTQLQSSHSESPGSEDRDPEERRAVGLMAKSLHETVTHRDPQESAHGFQPVTPKMK